MPFLGNRTRDYGGLRRRGPCLLLSCVPLFRHEPREMRESAMRNDANRGFLLLLAAVVTGVIMIAVGSELAQNVLSRWM